MYCTGITIGIILSCKDSELVAGGAQGSGWEGMHVTGRFQKVGMFEQKMQEWDVDSELWRESFYTLMSCTKFLKEF